MDLSKLRVFYHVAKCRGVSAAARGLELKQSAISQSIKALEEDLGCRLFHRHARGMSLTEEGDILFKAARDAFSHIEVAENIMRERSGLYQESITIGTTVGLAATYVPSRVVGYCQTYPDAPVRIVEMHTHDIDNSAADVFICPYIFDKPELVQTPIERFPFKLCAAPSYIEKHGRPQTFQELSQHTLIAFPEDSHNPFNRVDRLLFQDEDSSQQLRRPLIETFTSTSLMYLVSSGVGIGVLSTKMPGADGLIDLFPDLPAMEIEIYFVVPKRLAHIERFERLKQAFLK
jgi:DNA-binding transcriptional LysR family regulator